MGSEPHPHLLACFCTEFESKYACLNAKWATLEECCIEEFDIDYFIGFYLINNDAFHQKRLSVRSMAQWRHYIGLP